MQWVLSIQATIDLVIGYNPPSAPHPNDPSRTSVSGMGGKLAFLKSQGESANACRVSKETAFSVPIVACPPDRCSSLQNALPVEGRLNSSHGDHSHSVHPVRTDGSTITELPQFVVFPLDTVYQAVRFKGSSSALLHVPWLPKV